jgi:hypothetical protein
MAEAVYALCSVTSTVCAILLLRGYKHSRTSLLLWSGLCFAGLAVNNIMLLADVLFAPTDDSGTLRSGIALMSMVVLLIGLVWERP